MPERVYSALNTGGTQRVGEGERLRAQLGDSAANRGAQAMLQQALLAENARQFDAQFGDRAAQRSHDLAIQGAYRDKAQNALDLADKVNAGNLSVTQAQALGNLGVARESNAPQMYRAQLEGRMYDDVSGERKAKSAAEIRKLEREAAIQDTFMGDVKSPGFLAALNPSDRRAATLAVVGSSLGLGGSLVKPDAATERAKQIDDAMLAAAITAAGSTDAGQRQWGIDTINRLRAGGGSPEQSAPATGTGPNIPWATGFGPAPAQPASGGFTAPPPVSKVTVDSLRPLLEQQLPAFIDRDTDSMWSRAAKGLGFGGFIGAGANLLSGPTDDAASGSGINASQLTDLYAKFVQAFTRDNGGDPELAKQQALALFQEVAKAKSSQKGDYLDDWDADETRALFQGFGK